MAKRESSVPKKVVKTKNQRSFSAWATIYDGQFRMADGREAPSRVPCTILIDEKYFKERE